MTRNNHPAEMLSGMSAKASPMRSVAFAAITPPPITSRARLNALICQLVGGHFATF